MYDEPIETLHPLGCAFERTSCRFAGKLRIYYFSYLLVPDKRIPRAFLLKTQRKRSINQLYGLCIRQSCVRQRSSVRENIHLMISRIFIERWLAPSHSSDGCLNLAWYVASGSGGEVGPRAWRLRPEERRPRRLPAVAGQPGDPGYLHGLQCEMRTYYWQRLVFCFDVWIITNQPLHTHTHSLLNCFIWKKRKK